MNLASDKVQIMFVVRRRFAISRISDNCLAGIRSYRTFDDELFQKNTSRSSRSKILFKIYAPKNFATGKHPCWSLQHRRFPVKFAKFLRTPFFTEHLRWLLLNSSLSSSTSSLSSLLTRFWPVFPFYTPWKLWKHQCL